MKKYYLFISVFSILSLTLVSCDKWLDDVKQTGEVTDEIVWQDVANVNKNVNAFYTFIHKYSPFGDAQFQGNLTESLTDAFKYGSVALGNRAGFSNNYVFNPEVVTPDGCLYNVWTQGLAYGSISQVNQFLDSQKKYSKFSDDKNIIWEAQARFFRAFLYFQLAKRHGSVVIYDALPESNDVKLSSEKETWDFIAKDLEFAAKNLPEKWPDTNKNRVTKGAVYAFLSRVMLYASRWQEAYDAAAKVQELGFYALVDNYAEAWKGNNAEAILEFDYNKNSGPFHSFDKYYVPQCDGYDYGALGTPTQEMVESYETKDGKKVDWSKWHTATDVRPPYEDLDPRFAATIIYAGSTWKGKVMDCSVNGKNGAFMQYKEQPYSYGKTTTGYFLRKLLDESLLDIQGVPSSQAWVELRYAEVLLNKAEAAFRLNKINEAQALLNQVRARKSVQLPPKHSTGEDWFRDYRNERKVELAYEGHLFWDMRRWHLADKEYNNYRCHGMKITGNTYEYIDCDGQDRRFLKRLYRLPIPTEELKNNKLVEQFQEWK